MQPPGPNRRRRLRRGGGRWTAPPPVTGAPSPSRPRGPRGHSAAFGRRARGSRPGHRPDSALPSVGDAVVPGGGERRRRRRPPVPHRPLRRLCRLCRPCQRPRGTAERRAAGTPGVRVDVPRARTRDRLTATPSGSPRGRGRGRERAQPAARPQSRAHASRPQTAPSSQHRTLRRPRDAHPTARRHVAFLDDVRMRPGSAAAAPSSESSRDDFFAVRRGDAGRIQRGRVLRSGRRSRAPRAGDRPVVPTRRRRERRQRDRGRFRDVQARRVRERGPRWAASDSSTLAFILEDLLSGSRLPPRGVRVRPVGR